MSEEEEKIFCFDFSAKGSDTAEIIGKFTEAQAKISGLRGFVEKTTDGVKGHIQGNRTDLQDIKTIMQDLNSDEYKDVLKDVNTTEIKEIRRYTHDNFEFKQ